MKISHRRGGRVIMKERTPAAGQEINWPSAEGKIKLTVAENGHLPGAKCPSCGQETIYMYVAMALGLAGLAGMQTKFSGRLGIQGVCENPECDIQPSDVTTY